jgi:hypothetical protein
MSKRYFTKLLPVKEQKILFLCSKKLKPGDTIINLDTFQETILESLDQIKGYESHWCKKIAKIKNPEKHKENEEYHKSDVTLVWTNGTHESSSRFDLYPIEETYLIAKI